MGHINLSISLFGINRPEIIEKYGYYVLILQWSSQELNLEWDFIMVKLCTENKNMQSYKLLRLSSLT